MPDAEAAFVEFRDVTKRFGDLLAVDRVSLSIRKAEVHALVGENGAGKSTLMNILYGLHRADAGSVHVGGKAIALANPADALRAGIGMVHQHFKLAPSFTVAENVVLGAEPPASLGRFDRRAAVARTRELCARFGMQLDPEAKVADLPVGMQQKVEIIKAMHRQVRVLILDEPTAVLTPRETKELFASLGSLAAAGTAIIFITHKLPEVLAVSQRISVMRLGRIIATQPNRDITAGQIANLMVGRSVLLRVAKTRSSADPHAVPALQLSGLSVAGDRGEYAVRGLNLTVLPGEIVGLAGVQGNGQDELVQAVAGFRRPLAGRIEIGGVAMAAADPGAARDAGLAYIPADRGRTGLSLPSAIWENMVLGQHRHPPFAGRFTFRGRAARARAAALIRQFDVRGAAFDTPARSLSGGNQQKVVLARELSRDVQLIVAEQPSQGVDIGAIEAIHQLLVRMRDAGKGIFLVSADLDEVMSLSDRIAVIYRGEITGIFDAQDATVEGIGRLMGGVVHVAA
jgi:simple sugar transport system ATP-binding protein